MSKLITLKQLKDKGACESQLKLFQKLFGEQVEMTPELVIKHAPDFNWRWASANLLNNEQYTAYNEAEDTALKAYRKATIPALKAYKEARTTWKAFEEAMDTAWKAYEEACALAFYNCY